MSSVGKVGCGLACAAVVALEVVALAGWQGWVPRRSDVPQLTAAQARVMDAAAGLPVQITRQPAQEGQAAARPEDGYYDQLRRKIRWVSTRIGGDQLSTPDLLSRMLLAKSAAERASLHEVGLSFKDVYGIINAETSWIPRAGASKNGTPNLGIAQFEPATAKLLGMRDPDDPVESVHVAAVHMKVAARWSAERIEGLNLDADDRAARLREGVSIYYNLSSRGRAMWNGKNTKKLPRETQLHIYNARLGAQQADLLEAQLRAEAYIRGDDRAVLTASAGHEI